MGNILLEETILYLAAISEGYIVLDFGNILLFSLRKQFTF